LRCFQITKRNFRKSDSGSFAMGIPSEVVALKIFIRIVEAHSKKEN